MYKICTYNGQKSASFYIQSKGNYAGRPLRKPIPNCFAVYSENPFAFEIVYCLFKAKTFEYYIIGSVIPFIRIGEVKKILNQYLDKEYCTKHLQTVQAIDKLLDIKKDEIKNLMALQCGFARQTLNNS